MIRQVLRRVGFAAYADFYAGEILTAQFSNNGFNTVVPACGTFTTNAKTTGFQRYVIKQNDDPLRRDLKIGTELQHRSSG